MEIQSASIEAVNKSLRETRKEIPHDIKAETIIPLLSYLEKDRLPTLGKDVANHVETGLKIVGVVGLINMFRKRMSAGLTWSLRAARTTVTYAGRDTALLVYRASRNIEGWLWISALAPTTCMACIALHGTFHRPSERLNDHHSGMCWPKPVLKSYPIAIETGIDWFSNLSEAEQVKRMGESKYEMWKKGSFDFRDLITTYTDSVWGEMIREQSLVGIFKEK